jgi:chemotaxis protein CheZ
MTPPGRLGMGVQQKIYRIEQTLGHRGASAACDTASSPNAAAGDLAALRDTLIANKRELLALQREGAEPRLTRAAFELGAAIDGMEKATQKILGSAEVIDESAKTLAATLKTDYERGLAHDIQEQTLRLFEACHFQDIAGQRIGKAIAVLNMVEQQVARMIARLDSIHAAPAPAAPCSPAQSMINGPQLNGDTGHASQRDIDKLFA